MLFENSVESTYWDLVEAKKKKKKEKKKGKARKEKRTERLGNYKFIILPL